MATEVFIPKLGQTVEQVVLVKWLVPDGTKITQGQEILEVETDKAIFSVESGGKGWLHIGPYKDGDIVPVLKVVALIGKEDEKFVAPGAEPETVSVKAVEENGSEQPSMETLISGDGTSHEVFASPRARKLARENKVDVALVAPTGGEGVRVVERDVISYLTQAPKATPVAQRMASIEGVDLRSISGTGPGARITRDDVARSMQKSVAAVPQTVAIPLPVAEIGERIPLSGVRAVIADRMAISVHTTAHVTLMMEIDATNVVAMRDRLKAKVADSWSFTPGYNDILAIVVSKSLRMFPYMNARLAPDAIELLQHVNIGMAVDTERGLLVPVVRDVDQQNIQQFGTVFRQLVDRARNGRSLPDDLSGGTFTITNLGMYDIDAFTPVINLPECAILGVGRISPKPVARDNEVVIRQMLTLSLTFDHRLVDGAPAARFFQYIKELLEEPYLILVS